MARHNVAVAAAGEADREAAATRMASQGDRTAEPAAPKEAYEVDEIVLELPDIIDVAATPPRQIMSAQIGQHHLGRPAAADRRGKRVIAAAVIGRPVRKNEQPPARGVVEAIGELRAVARRILECLSGSDPGLETLAELHRSSV